ncbi:uncharacterized protein LOC133191420 isoform X2 [Saccostrea echinata]|uniref:uncharacterized protein LOC133191420 isoform X2 n=1 Tax=Saccostrea echinata TaxID=191078 RepID=UPI002A7F7DC7|nr:uncharacterized protein LOC133191420 isoform X2 [Saccostrea echinata]
MAWCSHNEKDQIPSRVSKWKKCKAIEKLGVFYAQCAYADPNDILEKLNNKLTNKRQISPPSESMARIKEFLMEYVNFNIADDEKSLRINSELTRRHVTNVEACMQRLSSLNICEYMQIKGIQDHELEFKRLLIKVYAKSQDFLEMMTKFLKMMLLPIRPYKSAYTELIRHFSNMCDLSSVPGDSFQRLIILQDQAFLCLPDIRFFQEKPESDLRDILVSTVATCERKNLLNPETNFNIEKAVDDKLLVEHGGGLLIESPYSFFQPHVLGSLCLKTEMLFTFLEIDMQHFDKLVCNEDLTSEKAYIFYTKPYNIMIAEDRAVLLDLLLRLSVFQRRDQ